MSIKAGDFVKQASSQITKSSIVNSIFSSSIYVSIVTVAIIFLIALIFTKPKKHNSRVKFLIYSFIAVLTSTFMHSTVKVKQAEDITNANAQSIIGGLRSTLEAKEKEGGEFKLLLQELPS